MYNFIVQAYATYKGLFYWLNWPGYISSVFLRPVAMIVIFSVLGRFSDNPDVARDYALGMAVFSMAFVILPGITQTYTYERQLGTISFLFVSPVSRFVNVLSRSVFHYPNVIISFASSLFAAWLIIDLNFGFVNWPGLILVFLVTAISMAAFSQFMGIYAIIFRDWTNTYALANGILIVLTGVIIPITVFPEGLQEFAKLLPMTNGLMAVRDTFAGSPLAEVYSNILREGLTAIGYHIIGYAEFILFERIAKKTGTLDLETL